MLNEGEVACEFRLPCLIKDSLSQLAHVAYLCLVIQYSSPIRRSPCLQIRSISVC